MPSSRYALLTFLATRARVVEGYADEYSCSRSDAYRESPLSMVSEAHGRALRDPARNESTALTNLFTGRPARSIVNRIMREVGPISDKVPGYPLAGEALEPLLAASGPKGSDDFMLLLSGQAGPLAVELPAGELTRKLWTDAQEIMGAS
jgi:nitronate monooxygenase